MKKLIISAPFGNYLNFPCATSTIGTFTLNKTSLIKRAWKVLKTVRYNWRQQSWDNKLELSNPGFNAIPLNTDDKIISIHGFNQWEWVELLNRLKYRVCQAIELNLSCPNVKTLDLEQVVDVAKHAMSINYGVPVIAKLSPMRWLEYGRALYDVGIRWFHLFNTIATPGGGMSGKPLKQYSLCGVEDFRKEWGDKVKLIGGGGITCLEDVKDYLRAGTDRVTVGSMLFNPFNWYKMQEFACFLGE